jgi:adenine-specific DNA-methyltransferase
LSPSDVHRVLHLALDDADDAVKQRVGQMAATLEDLGLAVSTGRVVDFRAKAFLRADPQAGAVPLIYPVHFNGGGVHWPRSGSRKPNALVAIHETNALLVPNGIYVLVKRFTAKEEKRRVVATIFP